MRSQYDIAAYTRGHDLILIGEVKGLNEPAESGAASFRRNLVVHGLLPIEPYFLLAYRSALYLWKPNCSAEDGPSFKAAAKPVFKRFLGESIEHEGAVGPESYEFAVTAWLTEIANGLREPDARTDAEKMLIDSGLYEKIRGGEVRRDFLP